VVEWGGVVSVNASGGGVLQAVMGWGSLVVAEGNSGSSSSSSGSSSRVGLGLGLGMGVALALALGVAWRMGGLAKAWVWAEGALGGRAYVRFRRLHTEGALGQEEQGRLASRVEQLESLLTES
jgi:hypothetical protein